MNFLVASALTDSRVMPALAMQPEDLLNLILCIKIALEWYDAV